MNTKKFVSTSPVYSIKQSDVSKFTRVDINHFLISNYELVYFRLIIHIY